MVSRALTSLRVTAPHVVGLVADSDDEPLGANEVRGRTIATLVSPGTEFASAFAPPDPDAVTYPAAIGYASVFEVDEVGAGVAAHRPGDVVFFPGPHRSVQRADEAAAIAVPAGLDPFVAVFARMIAVPMAALVTTTARPGDRVGISGLGLVGNLGAQAFHASGYRVTAWDPIAARRNAVPAGVRTLSSAADGDGAEYALVVEASGHDGAAIEAAKVLARNGELVLTGTPWARRTDATAHELLHLIFHRYLHVRSGWEWQLPTERTDFRVGSVRSNFRQALAWLESGAVDVGGLARVFPPQEAQTAFDALADRTQPHLTVAFDWR
jgi:threonine dehydrogenase-like Zn-dependent dehydrogenase